MFRHPQPDVVQEEDDLPWGRVIFAVLLAIGIGGGLTAWAWSLMGWQEARLRPSGAFPEKSLGPRHEVGMVQEALFGGARIGQQLFEAQRAELGRFRAVDRERGFVSIPIDAAIELVVKEHER